MSALTTHIANWLGTKPTITNLVGSRIYSSHLSQNENYSLPAISLTKIGGIPNSDLSKSATIRQARVQVDVWSYDIDEADAVSEAILTVLGSFKGDMDGLEVLATDVEGDDDIWLPEPPSDGSNQWLEHVARDYLITYRKPTP